MKLEDIESYESVMESFAREFRSIALKIDQNPESIEKYTNLESVQLLSKMMIPPQYNDHPLTINQHNYYGLTCLERVIASEWLSYGDAGVLLACPGPSLSGIVIQTLADDQQKMKYYSKLLIKPTWTFFALSEPNKGSDAMAIKTHLNKSSKNGYYLLEGEKYFIGNGSRGEIGIVFARSSNGPLGIEMVLIESNSHGFSAKVLDTLGVRGAKISKLKFEKCEIEREQIIGHHLSPLKRGIAGAIITFNKMRLSVAAMALGVSKATYDYVMSNRSTLTIDQQKQMEKYNYKIITTRRLIRQAAIEVDQSPHNGYIGSMAKIKASELVIQITQYALYVFGTGSMIEHPLLNKWFRDSFAFEYMEGTSNILKLNIFQNYINGRIKYV